MTTFYCVRFKTPPNWRVRSPYLYPPGTGETSVAQQCIYANHIENTSFHFVVFAARCMATEIIRLLSAYPLPRECVYRVVAQQWT
jgi:hypothetical protein